MAAFVLVLPASLSQEARAGEQLNLFPGSATPAIFGAGQSFWIGYGFLAEAEGAASSEASALEEGTRFELDVDGKPVSIVTDVRTDAGAPVRKIDIAEFPAGLPAGWHDFAGRWYDGGRLVLSSRTAIQFVE